ncbi:MAG: hypothetical protein ABEJ82_02750 [Haloplanus sp.]
MEPVTMSTSESLPTDDVARIAPEASIQTLAALAALPVRFVAFWVATLLPFTYLPLLMTGAVTDHPTGFAGMVAVNAVAFVVGHSYNRPE